MWDRRIITFILINMSLKRKAELAIADQPVQKKHKQRDRPNVETSLFYRLQEILPTGVAAVAEIITDYLIHPEDLWVYSVRGRMEKFMRLSLLATWGWLPAHGMDEKALNLMVQGPRRNHRVYVTLKCDDARHTWCDQGVIDKSMFDQLQEKNPLIDIGDDTEANWWDILVSQTRRAEFVDNAAEPDCIDQLNVALYRILSESGSGSGSGRDDDDNGC